MKRRPTNLVRVLGECARCGGRPIAYAVRRVDELLDVGGGRMMRHQLIVCQDCERWHAQDATRMEQEALSLDAADPIAAQRFFQSWTADLARVQRTAALFLGAERAAQLAAELRAERAKRDDEWDDGWEERYRLQQWEDLAR